MTILHKPQPLPAKPPAWVVEDIPAMTFRVHRNALRDESVFQGEMRAIFDRCWLYVGHESEIPRPGDLFVRSVFDVIRVRGGVVDRYVGVYEHQLLPTNDMDPLWLIGRRRVLIDHDIEAGGGSLSFLL